jgi:hypothetical protein
LQIRKLQKGEIIESQRYHEGTSQRRGFCGLDICWVALELNAKLPNADWLAYYNYSLVCCESCAYLRLSVDNLIPTRARLDGLARLACLADGISDRSLFRVFLLLQI